jgi:hypothetical protein
MHGHSEVRLSDNMNRPGCKYWGIDPAGNRIGACPCCTASHQFLSIGDFQMAILFKSVILVSALFIGDIIQKFRVKEIRLALLVLNCVIALVTFLQLLRLPILECKSDSQAESCNL